MNITINQMGMLGTPEIVVIAIVVLLLFGGKKIPEFMRGLGKGVREFRNASKGESDEPTETKE
ncbi:MAG: twin-arginine translocase TatA/TatE family subunit [Bacteroidetes bacterium HGW-Bacteroidetes-6]|jgi:sec-independent protein translocase protein TatA|nr:MAG: twin-arginine translocase TatA/TatE family subunit [Bacteroidetes bacterium HGW-Bacteroidetes-6]